MTEEFVWLALEKLKEEKLIENEIPTLYEGVSRREIVRKIGLSTLIALPVISSLVAPTQAQAASCVHTNLPCNPTGTFCPTVATPTPNTDCCSCICGAATVTGSGPRSRCT